ncbi:MAG: glycosyltransferase family 4 protein [Planctomycetota bacterium]|jgi:glycosyltransferase involved in cell wall biosynthesis
MKIAIDASPCAAAHGTGVATYVRELVKALAGIDGKNRYVLCTRISRLPRRGSFLKPPAQNFTDKIMVEGLNLMFPRSLDLFHGTDARAARLDVPQVITIHDLFQEESEKYSKPRFREKKQKYYIGSASRARAIIVPSEYVRKAFSESYPDVDYKVVVIPHGVGEEFKPQDDEAVSAVREKYRLPEKYILFVGSVGVRKNSQRLLDAFGRIAGDYPELGLMLAGKLSHGGEQVSLSVRTTPFHDRIRMPGYVPTEDLPALYTGASLFVLPSLSEGFGIPMLESFACGTPVVASDRTSIPEVAGDAAVLVDPEDTDSIAEGMDSVLGDEKLRNELIEKGKARAGEFTWLASAIAHLELYNEIVLETSS